MREIKFRGKFKFDGSWVYGYLRRGEGLDHDIIETPTGLGSDVDPKTVGQFTGLKDKNGVEIFEGDIVKEKAVHFRKGKPSISREIYRLIAWHDGSFHISNSRRRVASTPVLSSPKAFRANMEVIGNIFSNPDLLKTKEKDK